MKRLEVMLTCIAIGGLLVLACDSAAFEKPLRTEWVNQSEVAGSFTLILYGGNYFNDLQTIAFLDAEGYPYTFEPYAPAFEYRLLKGLSAREALDKAQDFVSTTGNCFVRSQLSKVLDRNDKTIGYELRPFYNPLCYGLADVLDVSYWNKDGKIVIKVKVKPIVEKQFESGDSSTGRDSGK